MKTIEERLDELELERLLNILHFKSIDDWIETMSKRWKKRVKRKDLVSLYKWIKHLYAELKELKERLDKLENPDLEKRKEFEKFIKDNGFILCPECKKVYISPKGKLCVYCERNMRNPQYLHLEKRRKKYGEGFIECPKCNIWLKMGTECPRCSGEV